MLYGICPGTSGVSVTFLKVGETNSMVDYHLMVEGNSDQLESVGVVSPPAGPGQHPDNNNNIIINNNNNNNSSNNNNIIIILIIMMMIVIIIMIIIITIIRKYWVDAQQGIVSSQGERDPL